MLRMRLLALFISCVALVGGLTAGEKKMYPYRGWNILSSHRENGPKTLDKAAEYGINHIELSHYQLCHNLSDLRNPKNREATNFLAAEARKRGIEDVFVWDHAFYAMDYYPDRFKVEASGDHDLAHHTKKFEGGIHQQLNLDDPEFWEWVYEDYSELLSLAPDVNGIVLTFIETGSYVKYQFSEKHPTPSDKLALLVDKLGHLFIDQKNLKLTIRTFIYNQFEKEAILGALQKIQRDDITVMIKMVPHDWFLTYPYQDYVDQIPFPVVIEYDCGMEYAGENLIANTFAEYFWNAFQHYSAYPNVVGFCARADRYWETAAVGTPGELNLFLLAELAKGSDASADGITEQFIEKTYGKAAIPYLKPAFDSAIEIILSSMYTLGTHTANHSRLNFHRDTIYQTHTTGEFFPEDEQMYWVGHGVNRWFHNYKDIINVLSFPKYKTDIDGMARDLDWVLEKEWLDPDEQMSLEMLGFIITEKDHAVELAEKSLAQVEQALPLIQDGELRDRLYHTFKRTVIFTKGRRGAAKAVYGYRLWSRGEVYQTKQLQEQIRDGLEETEAMLQIMENYPVKTPGGQWYWTRDREAFSIYHKAITQTGWEEFGLKGVVVPELQH